jgi:dTDP-4-amino-4,6-dideoxygalactose transaminase
LAGLSLTLPARDPRAEHVFHQYVVRSPRREAVRAALHKIGIGTNIHYPMPVHLQPAYHGRIALGPSGMVQTELAASEVFSLPMYPQLSDAQIDRVIVGLRSAVEA